MPGEYLVPVDPHDLVTVTYTATVHGDAHLTALACRYVPVDESDGRRTIAVEILYDPSQQAPAQPYYCESARVQRVLISPRLLRAVRPYMPAAAPAPR